MKEGNGPFMVIDEPNRRTLKLDILPEQRLMARRDADLTREAQGHQTNDINHLIILLFDGTARMQKYKTSLIEGLLPKVLQMRENPPPGTIYMCLQYGDYAPASRHVVSTVYLGRDRSHLVEAIKEVPWEGGCPIRNALHEGMACVLDNLVALESKAMLVSSQLIIIPATMAYEEFHTQVRTRSSIKYSGKSLEDVAEELKSNRFSILVASPTENSNKSVEGIIGKVYGLAGSPISLGLEGWNLKHWPMVGNKPSSPSAGIDIDGDFDSASVLPSSVASSVNVSGPQANVALEVAVKQFLSAVLKLPQSQRAETIKRHLESPAYSAEYKQALIAMVKQLQSNSAPSVRGGGGSATGVPSRPTHPSFNGPASQTQPQNMYPLSVVKSPPLGMAGLVPTVTPLTQMTNRGGIPQPPISNRGSSPIWIGRVSFKVNNEIQFDVAAYPMANPKSVTPNLIPLSSEFNLGSWPLFLEVANFVPMNSAAISKSVPISKLVELLPFTTEPLKSSSNNECAIAFKNLLSSRQVVGLVRLGAHHAMLIAARPNQLIGMIIARTSTAPSAAPIGGLTHHPPMAGFPAGMTPMPMQSNLKTLPTPAPHQQAPSMSSASQAATRSRPGLGRPKASIRQGTTFTTQDTATLTPNEILRQRRPASATPSLNAESAFSTFTGTSSVPLLPSNAAPPLSIASGINTGMNNSIDVFNALMDSQIMDLDLTSPADSANINNDTLEFL